MFQILSTHRFIRNIRILNIIIGILSIPLVITGIWQCLDYFFNYYYQTEYVDFFYVLLFTIVSIMSCLIGFLTSLLFNKLEYFAIKLSKILYSIICLFLVLFSAYIIIFDFVVRTVSGGPRMVDLMFLIQFSIILVLLIQLILKINKNKDILTEFFSIKTCYNCQTPLKPPYNFCANCGVKQRSFKITSPSKFILKIRFFNFFIGIFFILTGSYGIYLCFLNYYAFVSREYQNLFSLIMLFIYTILSIIVGAIGILSSLFFKNLKFLGIKLSMILYILICAFSLLLSIYLIVFVIVYERGYIVSAMLLAYAFILFLNLLLFIPSILLFFKMFKNRDILREYFSTKIIIEKRKKMLEIKKPESFINNIKILNLILGFILILIGLNYEIRLIIRVFIVKGYFRDPIIWGLFGIFLLSSGTIGLISWYFLLKSEFLGLKLSMLTFIILCGSHLFMVIFMIISYVGRELSSLHLLAISFEFLFYTGIVVISIILLLSIYNNKDLLKECF